MFVCSGILFNHESPRRSLHFVTRKVTAGVACIVNRIGNPPIDERGRSLIGEDRKLHLGFLDSTRDWGYAKEYVDAMWRMMQSETPRDYVIGTNTSHTVRDLCRVAFSTVGLHWEDHVLSDPDLLRPTEISNLKGDYSLAEKELGWRPHVQFDELIQMMVEADLARFR
jgi:GDPmannose 4,6-dehydratase